MDLILGTPLYMAPELCKGDEYDLKVDVWSLGVIVYAMLCGNLPFNGKDNEQIRDSILESEVTFDKNLWGKVSVLASDFVLNCLRKDPKERLSVQELFEHVWIKKFISDPVIKEET